ncbi:DUF6468 domain-containing protein [Neokomagataea anthophila]|uniref:DUF6468 domain-containing protein n=1 Tax=Neokomagataea anthophila TaxID=2826925 RepID=A0ABS5E475_9PROT|nr:DUF6468 domain-containing protein [Neokomagataea anthophila]MBR0558694.1 hypothetical protein [Neokomagataea anthophila]
MDLFQTSLEVALLLMLLITLFVCLHLGRSLRALRRDRTDLDMMVAQLRQYGDDAQKGIDQLQSSSEGVGRALSKTVEAGQVLKQDLMMLCERSEALAEQLEGSVFQRRGQEKPVNTASRVRSAPAVATVTDATGGLGKSAAERELLRALRQKQG